MSPTFILDGIIAVLLLVTIGYCWRLSKKITLLHQGRKDLAFFLNEFNTSIIKAEENINILKTLGADADQALNEQIQKARFLANDLSFLVDKAENLADELESYIANSRIMGGAGKRPSMPGMRQPSYGAPSYAGQAQPQNFPAQNFPAGNFNRQQPQEQALRLKTGQIVNNSQENIVQQRTENTGVGPTMSVAKKQALENALAQIAARRSTGTLQQNANAAAAKPAQKDQKGPGAKTIAETLKALQRAES